MEKITATFRVVTPLFMSGADQTKAELRLTSIKGALRFWWRALAWAEYQGDIKAIRQAEAELFGSSDPKIGQAKVLMKLELPDNATSYMQPQQANDWQINQWESYVGYGLVDGTTRPGRGYIMGKSNNPFIFRLICIAQRAEDLAKLLPAIQLLGLLGNLGGRARKGWGSISLEGLLSSRESMKKWVPPENGAEYKKRLTTLLAKSLAYPKLPSYSAFSEKTRFIIGDYHDEALRAQKYLGQFYTVIVRDELEDKEQRKYFGLPRFDDDMKKMLNGDKGRDERRRASPIFMHVHQCPDGTALPIVLFLAATFLQTEQEYTQKGIDYFLEEFAKENTALGAQL